MTITARFDLKLDADDKDLLSRAASLMGTTLAGFVRIAGALRPNAALQKAIKATAKVKRA